MSDFNSSLPIRTETNGDVKAGLLNDADVRINPATEDKQDSAITELQTIKSNQTDGSQVSKITDGTDELAVNGDGSINVNIVDAAVGDDINVYGTASAGVPGTPTTVVDYTVNTGKTLKLNGVHATGSGKIKVEIKAGTPSSETTRAVGFSSTANPNIDITFPTPLEVVAGDKVLVIITNKDTANQDLYANISGEEVA
jgi:hypothetical protein